MIELLIDSDEKIKFTQSSETMMRTVLHCLCTKYREIFLWPQTLPQKLWFVLVLMHSLEIPRTGKTKGS